MVYSFETSIRVFYQNGDLSRYLKELEDNISECIKGESEDYLLNVNEEEYIKYKVFEYKIEYLSIEFEQAYAEQKEEMIEAGMFPQDFYVYSGKSYPKMVIYFHIPINGNIDLIRYTPSTRIMWTKEMILKGNELVFKKIQFRDDIEATNREFERIVDDLRTMEGYLNKDIICFNNSLRGKIQSIFNSRKQELLKRKNLLSSLKIPIKKVDTGAKTFSIPTPNLRKKITIKPIVKEKGYSPEPTLDDDVYREILNVIHSMGKEFERKPSVYSNKSEEQLRDHFLMLLEPNFEGSATGETFNKKGKTDILLRYDNSNVFIAECKFWKGKVGYLKTIDQLLNYLTWRDSKSAVVIFVKNKELSNVIKIIESETETHSNYLGFVNKEDETWFNFRFHTNGDKNREIKLAIMLYHVPDIHSI